MKRNLQIMLRTTARQMRKCAKNMTEAKMSEEVKSHGKELFGAAAIVTQWAEKITEENIVFSQKK